MARSQQALGGRPTAIDERAQVHRSHARQSEVNSAIFDDLRTAAFTAHAQAVIISHLGDGERGVGLHLRRLHNARERWTSGNAALRDTVVVAAGERVQGVGTVHVYVSGVLRWIVDFKRGDDFYVDCCEEQPAYYPWRRGKPLVTL